MVLAIEGLPDSSNKKMVALIIKVSRQMCSSAFKRRLVFRFTVIISANFPLLLKSLITKALEYKADLNFKNYNLHAVVT